jgi:hypothetical protein
MIKKKCPVCGWTWVIRISQEDRDLILREWEKRGYLDRHYIQSIKKAENDK